MIEQQQAHSTYTTSFLFVIIFAIRTPSFSQKFLKLSAKLNVIKNDY